MKDLSGLDVHDYFRIFWNRRWYFLVVFALVGIGGSIYASLRPDFYRSEAKIAVDIPLSSITRSTSSVQERIDLFREQLSSRNFLVRMIQQTGAYGWGSSDFEMERALEGVRKNVKITRSTDRTFTIAYIANDPVMAQTVTRQFSEELIRASRWSTTNRVMTVDRFVEERFSKANEKLNEQSEKIRQFKLQNAGKLPEQSVSNMNAIAQYLSQLNSVENTIRQAWTNKENLEFRHEERKRYIEQLALANLSSKPSPVITVESSPEERDLAQKMGTLARYEASLAQALVKYTENHPDVTAYRREISRLEEEIEEAQSKVMSSSYVARADTDDDAGETPRLTRSEIEEEIRDKDFFRQISLIEADIAKREKERETILTLISELEARVKTAPTLEQDLADLLREEALAKREYDSLVSQKLNTGLASAVETDSDNEVYRIIDEANLPVFPVTSRLRLFLMAIGGALVLGIAAAFGRELLDTTIGSEEEASKVFNLPVLAGIPAAPKKNKKTELRKTA